MEIGGLAEKFGGLTMNDGNYINSLFQVTKATEAAKEIVVKVDLQDTKVRRKVLAEVAGIPGVISFSYMEEEMRLVVTGESVDLNILVSRLRKWSPEAELLSYMNKGVGAKESGKEKPEKEGNSGGKPSKEEGKKAEYVSNTDATGLVNQGFTDFHRLIQAASKLVANIHVGASGEERGDKVDAENTDHYPNTAASSHEVLQDPSIVTPPSIPAMTHHPDNAATSLENRDYNEQRLGRQVLELEKEVEGKRILLLFGEGYEFEKETLIQLWMALGFLTDEPMEVMGADCFEKLVSEGYILWNFANSLYKVNTGKLNTELDMITDRRNYVILDNGSQNDAASVETMHVSVVCDEIDESVFTTLGRLNRLRLLLFLRNYGSRLQEVPRDIFLCYESLVALDLSGAHIKELPSSAEKMIHLRFLDLSWTCIEILPERIDNFKMLQTLKLKGCSHLHRLPKELKGLTELRHLDLDVLGQLASFPENIGALVNLRTLSAFPVGIEEGLKISELKYLDNLTGEFCIAKLENVESAEEAKGASLTTKRSIKQLELRWSDHQFQEPMNEDKAILENLCPYSDLEEIQILCYPGTSFPGWITDVSLHKLVSITLFRCVHVSVLPSLEKLPSLVSLELISLNSVENVDFKGGVDHVAFPKLEKLAVDEMLNVESWAEAQESDYPCLVNVSIKDCPKLSELPSLLYLPTIKQLEVSGCTELAFVSDKELSSSLLQLIVEDCPLIKERCSEEGGQDWHKIEQVPTIWIDQVPIKTNEDHVEEEDDDDEEDEYDEEEEEDKSY